MKSSVIFFSFLLAATAFTFSNCDGNKKEASKDEHEQAAHKENLSEATETAETGAPQFTVDADFQRQLSDVFNAYLSLKEAFVSSDAARVSVEAGTSRKSLGQVDMKFLSGVAHNDWMNYRESMELSLKAIETSSDIEAQREAFSHLSENLYKSIKAYGLGGTTAYYEFCPMAFNNQGAYWLSDAEEIRNPYFGDKMLTCGSVKERLK